MLWKVCTLNRHSNRRGIRLFGVLSADAGLYDRCSRWATPASAAASTAGGLIDLGGTSIALQLKPECPVAVHYGKVISVFLRSLAVVSIQERSERNRCLRFFELKKSWTLSLSPDGGWVFSRSEDMLVKIWATETRAEVGSFAGIAMRLER